MQKNLTTGQRAGKLVAQHIDLSGEINDAQAEIDANTYSVDQLRADRESINNQLQDMGMVPPASKSGNPGPAKSAKAAKPKAKRKAGKKRRYKPGKYTRDYTKKGEKTKTHTLIVNDDGVTMRCGGKKYTSPTAAAKAITEYTNIDGKKFFGMK